MLNNGLLIPKYIVETTLDYNEKNKIPLNSFEEYNRQIIGWREFIKGVYVTYGSSQRTKKYWKFKI